LFAIIEAAGWPIWPLLIASVIGLALIIERLMYLRRSRVLPEELLPEVVRVYESGKVNEDVIETLEQNSPLGQVLAAGLRNVDAPREVMKEAIEEAGQAAAHRLESFLTTLGTIASLAPLMGLFGTVIGMIEIFASQNAAAQIRRSWSTVFLLRSITRGLVWLLRCRRWCFTAISAPRSMVLWSIWSSRPSSLWMLCTARGFDCVLSDRKEFKEEAL